MELEAKLREREVAIERLERDRRFLSDRETEEREEKERERVTYEEERVRAYLEILRGRRRVLTCRVYR